jgi:hypothetical protein
MIFVSNSIGAVAHRGQCGPLHPQRAGIGIRVADLVPATFGKPQSEVR